MSEPVKEQNPFSADEFAAPVLAEVAAMDNESIGKEVVRMTGGGWWNLSVYQDAFERMTPERALGLYVLVQVLNDIEPLDSEPDPRWNLKRQEEHFRHEHAKRLHRVAHHQKLEQDLRREGLELKAAFRACLRELRRTGRCEVTGIKGRNAIRGGIFRSKTMSGRKTKAGRNQLRAYFDARWRRYQARREDLDLTNTSLEYVLRDRADVRLWCDVSDVNMERFYAAVERRLLLKGRCSIELHGLLCEMREGRRTGPRAHDLLARYEARAFAVTH